MQGKKKRKLIFSISQLLKICDCCLIHFFTFLNFYISDLEDETCVALSKSTVKHQQYKKTDFKN